MYKNILSIITCLILATQLSLGQIAGKICNWDNDKKASVVLTFDDWSPGQFPLMTPELKSRMLNATFFITLNDVASWNHDWPDVLKTAADGNEIGNHTFTHPDLTTKTPLELQDEIRKAKLTIDQHISSQTVLSFAYPFGAGAGSTSQDIRVRDSVKASGHIGARSIMASSLNYTYNFATKDDDYYKILTYLMSGSVNTNMFFTEVQNVMKGGGLLTYLYHSIDDANGTYGDNWFNKVTIDSLKKQLDTLVSVKDKIWITTFAQAIKYHRENKCASLTEIQPPNGSQWIINLTDTLLDNAIYNQPLSIKLKRSGINYNRITQGNSILKIDSVLNDTIMFHAVPDAGPIILEANVMGIIENESLLNDIFIQPIPCNESLTIYSKKSLPNCQISIIDMTGKEITTIKQDIENSIQLDLSSLKKGIYLIRIDQNEYNIIKRIILN